MPTLPTPTLLALNPGVYNNAGTNKGKILALWDFPVASFDGVTTITFSYEISPAGAGTWTALTTTGGQAYFLNLTAGNYDIRIKATAAGFTDSGYVTGSVTVATATTTASAIVAHTALAALNVTVANGSPQGSVKVSWTPAGGQYTRTRVTLSAAGQSDVSADTSDLVQTITLTGVAVGLTWLVSIVPIAVLSAGTVISTHSSTVNVDVAIGTAFWNGPSELFLTLGFFSAAKWDMYGVGTALTGQSSFSCPGTGFTIPESLVAGNGDTVLYVSGVANEQGIKAGEVRGVLIDVLGAATVVAKVVTVAITGPLCVGWFNIDSNRTDLQLNLRTRAIQSYQAPGDGGVTGIDLRLPIGQTKRLYILQRDAAGAVIVPALTAATLILRAKNRPDGAPLALQRVTTPGTESINGHAVHYLDITPDPDANPALARLLDLLDSSASADAASRSIECDAELILTPVSGVSILSLPFKITLDQDLAA